VYVACSGFSISSGEYNLASPNYIITMELVEQEPNGDQTSDLINGHVPIDDKISCVSSGNSTAVNFCGYHLMLDLIYFQIII